MSASALQVQVQLPISYQRKEETHTFRVNPEEFEVCTPKRERIKVGLFKKKPVKAHLKASDIFGTIWEFTFYERNGDPIVKTVDVPSPRLKDPYGQLKALKNLYDEGCLSTEEFNRLKEPVVGKIEQIQAAD